MEDLIGLLVFLVIAIFGVAARYKESQRAKKDMTPPAPPKPRPQSPRQPLPEKTLRQFERREIRTARPATAAREARPPQQRRAQQVRAPAQPRPAPPRPQPVLLEQQTPRLRPEQVRAQQKPVMRQQMEVTPVQMRAGRQAAREALQQAVEQESDTGFETTAAAGERHAKALPSLFRTMQGIRAGIIFSEIIGPPVSLR